MSGSVTLVGAGPGAADLLTVRGMARLRAADVVVHDRLIDPALLRATRPGVECIDAGKQPGRHRLTQDEINTTIIAHAKAGRQVVRLKGGDPFVYGRGWEERAACRAAGVPCEVVPGLSSALAAPAAADIPVTLRNVARTVTIATPQSSGGPDLDALDWAGLAASDTLVLLMSVGVLAGVAERLVAAGKPPDTPAAIIERASFPNQRCVRGVLGDLARRAAEADVSNPAVVVFGATAGLGVEDGDDGGAALRGRRIVVTRPATASSELIRALRARGAAVVEAPLIDVRIRRPDRWRDPAAYGWLVFTSLHGARGFAAELRRRGLDGRALGAARIAAVGPKTAAELERGGLLADLVPGEYRAEALVAALVERIVAGPQPTVGHAPVLFVGGSLARDVLPRGLRRAGIEVDVLEVYRTHTLPLTAEARGAIEQGVDAILLYSPSAARALHASGVDTRAARIAAIGPTTAAALAADGRADIIVPAAYSDAGMLAAVESALTASEVSA